MIKQRFFEITYGFDGEEYEEYGDAFAVLSVDTEVNELGYVIQKDTWNEINVRLWKIMCKNLGVEEDEIKHFEWWYGEYYEPEDEEWEERHEGSF